MVGGGGCGRGRVRKGHRGGGIREGDVSDILLNINISWPFVKLIEMFTSLLNFTFVSKTEQSLVGHAGPDSTR